MSLSAAVLLVTSGRSELTNALQSIWHQTRQVETYVVTDGVMSEDEFEFIRTHLRGPRTHFAYWPGKIGGDGWEGRRLIASSLYLINEDVTFILQDDDWYKPNHVESLMEIIEDGNDWAYSLMSVYDKEGNFLFDDICECLGEEHSIWNSAEHFAPTGSVACKTDVYRSLAPIYSIRGYGVDRIMYQNLKSNYPQFRGSKQHTNCFRLGGNPGSTAKEFFEQGIAYMNQKYPNGMPWR